jgi:hypothetical protein
MPFFWVCPQSLEVLCTGGLITTVVAVNDICPSEILCGVTAKSLSDEPGKDTLRVVIRLVDCERRV